jgi:AraC-like DNA-binding protein
LSSAGLLHGILFAFYLIAGKKKKTLSNRLLGLILIFMAFRIGKSVMLYFGNDLEPVFIFIGLAFLLVTGPLLKWYVSSMIQPGFQLQRSSAAIQIIPFGLFFLASLFVTKEWFESSKWVVPVFSAGLIFIYLHLAFYISMSWRSFRKVEKNKLSQRAQTRSQKAVLQWIRLVIIGLMVIWISYVLNILDEAVPYVAGPIMYSVVIYYLSFKAFNLKTTDMDGSVFETSNNEMLFTSIEKLVRDERMYLDSELTLSKLSDQLGNSKQQISAAINEYAQRNFNDYVNYFRIQVAKKMLQDGQNDKFTISSIAFDTGFSSLSSFNGAFKKFEGMTPSAYRKNRS